MSRGCFYERNRIITVILNDGIHQYLKTIPAVWTAGFLFVLYKEQKLQVQTAFHAFDTRSKRSALFFVVSHTVRSALLLYLIIWGELSEVKSCLEIWKRLFCFRAQWGTPEHRYLYSNPLQSSYCGAGHTLRSLTFSPLKDGCSSVKD